MKPSEGFILHTLWGEIAYRLAGVEGYDIVRQSDEDRIAPGSEALERLFQITGPALILIDETLSYITKASGIPVGKGYLSDQAQEFLLELTRAVNATDNVALVLTMTSSELEQIGEAAIRAAKEIDTAIRILLRWKPRREAWPRHTGTTTVPTAVTSLKRLKHPSTASLW
jgi:predicted AAA+ superfamily ATPase